MLPSWIEEFDTLQQYIHCLFGSFQPIQVDRFAQFQSEPVMSETVQLLIGYGRKIMELSQQSTYKHRNQHYLSRKEVELELAIVYKNIIGEQTSEKYEKMIKNILQKFQSERQSIWMKYSMPQSRIIPASDTKNHSKKETLQQDRTSNMKNSKVKSKVSKVSTVKEVLQIKNYFQEEENSIRQFFEKLNKIIEINKVPTSNIEPQFLRFTKKIDENSSEKITDLIKSTTETHTLNISHLSTISDKIYDHITRKLRNQGFAQSKLTLYLEEIQRMEEVYSYTLSKMLEKLALAKEALTEDTDACSLQLESIEEITRKLYGLYPSEQSFRSLAVKIKGQEGSKSYGIQVSMGKTQQQKKVGSQVFRLQVRVNQILDRFEKSTKFRKTFELKEIQKLLETIKQILPVKPSKTEIQMSYQQQFKGLLQLHEKREKQLVESSSKKIRKSQKRIQQLQTLLQEMKKKLDTVNDDYQLQRKKIIKKLEAEQSQMKRLSKEKSNLDANLTLYIQEIQKMRQEVKKKGQEQSRLRRMLQKQCEELRQKWQLAQKRVKQVTTELRAQKQKISEQRAIYRSKIQLTENQLEEQHELSTNYRIQLQQAISQNQKLRQQLSEMSKTYQQKIRQVEEMIFNVRELHQIKQKQEVTIQQLECDIRQQSTRLQGLQKDKSAHELKIEELMKDKSSLELQVRHWKEQGKLTDSDLKILKDEVEKVSRAYIDSQEQLEDNKHQLSLCNQERQKLFRERLRLNRLVEDLQGQITALRTKYQATELAQRDIKEQYYQANSELKRNQKEIDELKKQLLKARKETSQQREQRARNEKELRQLRQQSQSRRETESLEQGKRRMQLQNLRVQLRKKTEQLEKQRQVYEQKLSIANQKMKQLQQFTGQKQLLSRLLQNHQSQ